MIAYLLDTDMLSLIQHVHPVVLHNIGQHPLGSIAISAISIHEQMLGVLAAVGRARNPTQIAVAYHMLVHQILPTWSHFPVLSFIELAILRFEGLRSMRLNVGQMDLRIAAAALENTCT